MRKRSDQAKVGEKVYIDNRRINFVPGKKKGLYDNLNLKQIYI